jgi:hypothetical protein
MKFLELVGGNFAIQQKQSSVPLMVAVLETKFKNYRKSSFSHFLSKQLPAIIF